VGYKTLIVLGCSKFALVQFIFSEVLKRCLGKTYRDSYSQCVACVKKFRPCRCWDRNSRFGTLYHCSIASFARHQDFLEPWCKRGCFDCLHHLLNVIAKDFRRTERGDIDCEDEAVLSVQLSSSRQNWGNDRIFRKHTRETFDHQGES
jgi:hypothetical protein